MEATFKAFEVATVAAQKEGISEEWCARLLTTALNLVSGLQRPEETLMREAFWMGRFMAMRVLHDLSIFDYVTEKGQVTSGELAELSKADQTLLVNRNSASNVVSGLVVELDKATYEPNQLTIALTNRHMKGMVEYIFDGGMETMAKVPAYLAEIDYKNPDDQAEGPLQYRYDAQGQGLFRILGKLLDDPERTIVAGGHLYVDVAGGRGHDLFAFKQKFAEHPDKYYLFDLPHIAEDHEKCLAIVKNVTASMKRGYSQLIIEDFILPPTGTTILPALFDMQMIAFLVAMERTEKHWRELLGDAGLVVEGFHLPPGDGTGIIVTSLK
ncbi:S-adenosyl-L-methionine-dependent methyltransferase [Macroventuria anomochaeta]|uniref:S-adenosyl-L-methionine-dependent methyltransferase n=1 Tax=Macroventuria anomochaeta TaxID=301207 RepID=A0ACB6RR33_9PLEO|nr:S-adenosyl-L-methionine-dependent methyltransferase [Macroventuria anomochaeta]KAF2624501.1 S-adenosyl-L-methionine-dependent methyltransferase [Macroventuria anomochaeta]